jgi:ABC-type transport system involved in cytochrome bd biosynthesis fused ATPase/permease subunit
MRSKVEWFTRENETLTERRKAVMAEYTTAAADLSDDPKSVKRRTDALAAVKRIDAELAALQAATDRFKAVRIALGDLADAGVVINTLVWDAGQAIDGLNPLQPVLEERFVPPVVTNAIHPGPTARPPIWVQTASGAVGSVWAGPARDADGNGVL